MARCVVTSAPMALMGILLGTFLYQSSAFSLGRRPESVSSSSTASPWPRLAKISPTDDEGCDIDIDINTDATSKRRRIFLSQSLQSSVAIAGSTAVATFGFAGEPFPSAGSTKAWAAETTTTTTTTTTAVSVENTVELKLFVDPQGLFVLQLPKRFFVLRRTAKGDLPDEKTGSGRRGSSILNAGDMAKAEVLAVERVLLEENGIAPSGSLRTFPDLGDASAIATLIALRRDKDKPGGISNTKLIPNSAKLSDDGLDLSFELRTAIDVQKPDLLMEQYGVRELFRITSAKASLRSNDGNILAVFASALEQDWQGPDGVALQQSTSSFQATDQSKTVASS